MNTVIPSADGEVNVYNLSQASADSPRIYFVNGIRVPPRDHAVSAALLSLLTEHPVHGVYNRTAGLISGFVFDLAQCLADYTQNATARLGSKSNAGRLRDVADHELPALVDEVMSRSVVWNKATASLFRQLVLNRSQRQLIVAHSQGNLIASNALFVYEDVMGGSSMGNIRVYSLASPAPAWPLGIRKDIGGGRQDNAFMNDMVALLRPHNMAAKMGIQKYQNDGDFRPQPPAGSQGGPHDSVNNMALNFLKSIRNDLGKSPDISDRFLEKCARIADSSISTDRSWWQTLDDYF